MIIESISNNEYLEILKNNNIDIPVYADQEALDIYSKKEIIKVVKNDCPLAVFLVPINNNGVRREYRFFPYISPIFINNENNYNKKKVLKIIFNYLFNKYDYCFIPLHPSFKMISAIQSEGGFVEMRHTHVTDKKMSLDNVPTKLRNHIRNALKQVEVVIERDYNDYDFNLAIKGDKDEIFKRSDLAKKLIDSGKGLVIKGIVNGKVKAGIICIYDKEWAYLLHSYQDKTIRGIIPLIILKANEYLFDEIGIKYFDFEGSVIDEIDDFFSSFNVNIVNYPYIIESKFKKKFYGLINRSMNIEGRIKEYESNK